MGKRKGGGRNMLDVSQEHSIRLNSHSTFHSLTKQKSSDYGLSMLKFRSLTSTKVNCVGLKMKEIGLLL
jgi:hypothetical protein